MERKEISMQDFDDLLHSPQAAKLEQLKDAPETRKLFSMLSKNTDGSLEQAADSAARGDSAQLMAAIRQLMQDPEAAGLIRQMKEKLR